MKEIKIFEEIRKDLTSDLETKIPMSYVFGRGAIQKSDSFGNKSLQENAFEVDKALENMSDIQEIWNHSHSQWMWKHLNLSHYSPYSNMRQIAAEVSSRKAALNDAKWSYIDNEVKAQKIQEQLNVENLDYWKEVELKVELAKIKESMSNGLKYIEGAMKDVLTLNSLFEQLKNKLGCFSEYDIEKEELRSNLKRSISQCIRDVRELGSITKGEQEYLEQIGVNPSKMQSLLRAYVNDEGKINSWDVSILHGFIDSVVEDLISNHKIGQIKMEIQGFSEDPVKEFTHEVKITQIGKN